MCVSICLSSCESHKDHSELDGIIFINQLVGVELITSK